MGDTVFTKFSLAQEHLFMSDIIQLIVKFVPNILSTTFFNLWIFDKGIDEEVLKSSQPDQERNNL